MTGGDRRQDLRSGIATTTAREVRSTPSPISAMARTSWTCATCCRANIKALLSVPAAASRTTCTSSTAGNTTTGVTVNGGNPDGVNPSRLDYCSGGRHPRPVLTMRARSRTCWPATSWSWITDHFPVCSDPASAGSDFSRGPGQAGDDPQQNRALAETVRIVSFFRQQRGTTRKLI